jgi:hypothetical protein
MDYMNSKKDWKVNVSKTLFIYLLTIYLLSNKEPFMIEPHKYIHERTTTAKTWEYSNITKPLS